ncbi:MAG: 16S rRNA (guanine(966)-N(2))-methyltransferase RsmD [Gaiellaceae bacterium]
MRIIAGSRKGARIFAPKGRETRPTSDRAREAAFNLIGPVEGARVLDLFAGSGAMGLEALSRGAASAVFVEADRDAHRTIERNLDKLDLTGARLVNSDALRFLATDTGTYDLVLCDPPYGAYEALRPTLERYLPPRLSPHAVVVLETPARDPEPELALPLRTSRRYGAARITLWQP